MKKLNQNQTKSTARTMNCPRCQKRAFDVIGSIWQPVSIELKCPHCKNIVSVELFTTKDLAS